MSIGALTSSSVLRQLTEMKSQLNLLQQQLGTGQRATTYSGLGAQRSLSLNAHARLQSIASYQQNIDTAGLRMNVIQTTLGRFNSLVSDQRNANLDTQFTLANGSQTASQIGSQQRLDEMLGLMNQSINGRYLFSGRATNGNAVLNTSQILDGDPPREGLKAVIEERRRADMGSDDRGRLAITAPTAHQVRLSETGAGAFGLKISAITESMTNATASTTAGPPKRVDVSFSGVPRNGDNVQISFDLPDGTSTTITLRATTSETPGPGEFTLGSDANATATNFQTALDTSLQNLTKTKLRAASAIQASNDFFNVDATHVPQRVNILTTPEEATSLRDGDVYGPATAVTTTQAEILGNTGNGGAITAADSTLYSFTVDTGSGPQLVSYTSGIGATQGSIVAGLLADFTANVPGAGVSIEAVANDAGTGIRVRALTADTDITIGAGAGNSGLTAAAYDSTSLLDRITAGGGAGGDQITVSVNGGANQPVTFGTGLGQVSTLAELNTALGALTGVTASVAGNTLSFSVPGTDSQNSLVVTGSSAGVRTALGLTAISGETEYGVAPTVIWYTGDDAVDSARSTSTVKVDTSLTLGYGLRATETGFRRVVASLAAFASVNFDTNDTASSSAYLELSARARDGLGENGGQSISSISAEIASTQNTMKAAQARNVSFKALFEGTISSIESVTPEEVAALVLDLQTRLQASYQVTANLSKLSLVNFL